MSASIGNGNKEAYNVGASTQTTHAASGAVACNIVGSNNTVNFNSTTLVRDLIAVIDKQATTIQELAAELKFYKHKDK